MQVVLTAIGVLLLVVTFLDAIKTTLSAGAGGGPLTRRISGGTWQVLRRIVPARLRPHVLPNAGPMVLLLTGGLWVLGMWAGWTLIFAAEPQAVLDAQTSLPATLVDRIYYVAFVIFTLGVGDFVAGPGIWRLLTSVATFGGLFLITLSITYLISVVSAAVGRRHLAKSVHLLGSNGADIVGLYVSADGTSSELASQARNLSTQIVGISQQHLAYPVLHAFHTREQEASAPYAIALLDDALLILAAGLREDARPGTHVLAPLRRALEGYGATVDASIKISDEAPPLPSLSELRSRGVPVVDDALFAASACEHQYRRRTLHALVLSDSWDWPAAQ